MSLSRFLKALAIVGVIALPVLIHWGYRWWTALPETTTIATGPERGEYHQLSVNLEQEIESQLGVVVVKHSEYTQGSLEHLQLLKSGSVDFALYQRGSHRALSHQGGREPLPVAFVANLYSEVTLFWVRHDVFESDGVRTPGDLQRGGGNGLRRVAVGLPESGEYTISQTILRHFNIAEEVDQEHLSYPQIKQGFADDSLDAAFITAGMQSPIFAELSNSGRCRLGHIPEIEAITLKNLSLRKFTIPAGLFRDEGGPIPAEEFDTVAVRAQLLTHNDVPSRLVEEVTRLVLTEDFIRQNQLAELSVGGQEYANHNPEFPVHSGALQVYEPELQPIVNPDFVEATEGLRSLAVSLLIALFISFRWFRDRREKARDHRLDQYIQALLEIDRRQLTSASRSRGYDVEELQRALDEVTDLRQQALKEFSAHELGEDRAVDCFLELCHAVSQKISDKLLHRRIDKLFHESVQALQESRDVDEAGKDH